MRTGRIQDGMRVKHVGDNRLGFSRGPVFHFSVWWIMVEWDDTGFQYVLEECLEVISENR